MLFRMARRHRLAPAPNSIHPPANQPAVIVGMVPTARASDARLRANGYPATGVPLMLAVNRQSDAASPHPVEKSAWLHPGCIRKRGKMRSKTEPADTHLAVSFDPRTCTLDTSPTNTTASPDAVDPDTLAVRIVMRTGASAWAVANLTSASPGMTSESTETSSRSRNNEPRIGPWLTLRET